MPSRRISYAGSDAAQNTGASFCAAALHQNTRAAGEMGRGRGRPLPSPLRRLPLPHPRVPLSAPVVRPRGGPPAGGRSCSGRSHRAWYGPLVAHCGAFGPLARGPPAGPFRRRSRLCVRGCGVVRPPPSRFAPALPPPLARRSAPVSVARPAGGWSLRWGAVGVPRPVAAAGRGFSPRSLFVPPAPRLRSRFRSTEARISLRAVSWRFPSRWLLSALWWPFWASAALLVR